MHERAQRDLADFLCIAEVDDDFGVAGGKSGPEAVLVAVASEYAVDKRCASSAFVGGVRLGHLFYFGERCLAE